MTTGTTEEQAQVRNRGIPWNLQAAATQLEALPPAVARTLSNLEARRLVCCWAEGSGRGRRVSHVKLSAQAVEAAQAWAKYGMSKAQAERSINRTAGDLRAAWEAGRVPDWAADLVADDPNFKRAVNR